MPRPTRLPKERMSAASDDASVSLQDLKLYSRIEDSVRCRLADDFPGAAGKSSGHTAQKQPCGDHALSNGPLSEH
jgi:hypothetical protein